MSDSFVCPHNDLVSIVKQCCIAECPFHVEKASQLFEVETVTTNCIFYDTDLMANVSESRTQISALSRDKRRLVSPKAMKSMYEDSLLYMKTLYTLTHKVGNTKHTCNKCGYPTKTKFNCSSTSICNDRLRWAQYVLSLYGIENSLSKFQLVWELLLTKQIHLEEKAKELGVSFCSNKDLSKFA